MIRLFIDGDGCPRPAKEILFRWAQRGAAEVIVVANRDLAVPKSARVRAVRVARGLDVADDWLVANTTADDLVVTSDVPLAAELVAQGVTVLSPRGEAFTPGSIGEKLSLRDFFTEARAAGLVEGGGPPPYDERARRKFADALSAWITKKQRQIASLPAVTPPGDGTP
jgi:uncharacterized protein YaiI (UPF0178 family)